MKQRAALAGLLVLILAAVGFDLATFPPPLPGYAHVRAAWKPSEAWLYYRHGVLIDSARVNFAARRRWRARSARSGRAVPMQVAATRN